MGTAALPPHGTLSASSRGKSASWLQRFSPASRRGSEDARKSLCYYRVGEWVLNVSLPPVQASLHVTEEFGFPGITLG